MPDPGEDPLIDSVTIHYYNTDDGIWLRCVICNWAVRLGFEPTVALAIRHVEAHTADGHNA